MKNGSAGGSVPHHEPAEAALMQEFASYLAQLSTSFSAPLAERMAAHEKDIVARVKKLADDIDRQRQLSVDRLAEHEKDLVSRLKRLADEVDASRQNAWKRLSDHERDIAARIKKLADDVERQAQESAARIAKQEADLAKMVANLTADVERRRDATAKQLSADQEQLVSRIKALADEVDGHRQRVAETQEVLSRGLAVAIGPLQEAVKASTATFNERAGQVVDEFAGTKQALAVLSTCVSKTNRAIWICVILSLGSLATSLWLGLR